MLGSLRSFAGSAVAKVFLVVLVLAFGVWGIGDMLHNTGGNNTVATVGSKTIDVREFQGVLRGEIENAHQMLGSNYSPELVRSLNLPQRALSPLIQNALIVQECAALGLVPSDADIVKRIRIDPAFFDKNGNFDKVIFDAKLRNASLSEKTYIDHKREEIAHGLLIDTLLSAATVSDTAVRTIYDMQEEQRSLTLYRLSPSLITDMPQPTDDQINDYYQTHAREFTAPEYRTVSYVAISSGDIHNTVNVSEAELMSAYKERSDEFKHPERRTVQQLIYDTEDKAKKAAEALKSGKTIEQVAADGEILNKTSLSLGKIDRNSAPENAADAIFALHNNENTAPIEINGTWRIFHVAAIDPPSVASFEEVRPALEKDLKQKLGDEAQNIVANQLEDALAGGSTLPEAAKDAGLKVMAAGPFSREGLDVAGNKVQLPALDKFVETSFKTEEKGDSSLTASKNGISYIVHVDNVTQEHLRGLSDVKAAVVTAWQKDMRAKRLDGLALDIGKQFMNADTRNSVIAKYNLPVSASPTIKYNSQKAGDLTLPPELVAEAFMRKPGEGTRAYPTENGNYLLAVVGSVIAAPAPDKDSKRADMLITIRRSLEANVQNEILSQYLHYLGTKYSVSINESALKTFP